jgi:peptide/nickel transport system permease protein
MVENAAENIKVSQKSKVSLEYKRTNQLMVTWKRLKRNKLAVTGLGIILFMIVLAISAPFLGLADPYKQNLGIRLLNIGAKGHILGTDEYGRDVLRRMVYGA